jgi:hypothetical protein
MGSGERFHHRRRKGAAFGAVMVLEFCHQPGEFTQREDHDLRREGGQLRTEGGLQIVGEGRHGCRKPPGHGRVREGGTQPEEPQAGGGDAVGAEPVKVRGAVADEDVTQQVIVEDDGGQLRRRQIGVLEGADEASMILSRKGARQEPLPCSGR